MRRKKYYEVSSQQRYSPGFFFQTLPSRTITHLRGLSPFTNGLKGSNHPHHLPLEFPLISFGRKLPATFYASENVHHYSLKTSGRGVCGGGAQAFLNFELAILITVENDALTP